MPTQGMEVVPGHDSLVCRLEVEYGEVAWICAMCIPDRFGAKGRYFDIVS